MNWTRSERRFYRSSLKCQCFRTKKRALLWCLQLHQTSQSWPPAFRQNRRNLCEKCRTLSNWCTRKSINLVINKTTTLFSKDTGGDPAKTIISISQTKSNCRHKPIQTTSLKSWIPMLTVQDISNRSKPIPFLNNLQPKMWNFVSWK